DPDRVAILDNFAWGDPGRPERLGELVRAARACRDAATAFGAPFISGKDSFHNEFTIGTRSIAVPPTLLISAVGLVDDVSKCVTMDAKEPGNSIYILGKTHNELGGSIYYGVRGYIGNSVPRVRFEAAMKQYRALHKAIRAGVVRACHDCSDGGLLTALAEMAFAGGLGMAVKARSVPGAGGVTRNDALFFSESNSRHVIEVEKGKEKRFREIMKGLPCRKIGEVNSSGRLTVEGLGGGPVLNARIESLKEAWQKPFRW
ncbi:MAG: AIR synthase-related protein, partial [bacterium]